jgi:hypothetical protein
MTNEQQEREVLNTLATLPERSRATILGVRVERLVHGYRVEGHEGTFLATGAAKLIVQAHAKHAAPVAEGGAEQRYDVRASVHELHGAGSDAAYDLLLDSVTATEVAEALRDVLTSDWGLTNSLGPFRLSIEIGPAGTGDDLLSGETHRWVVEWLDDSGDEDHNLLASADSAEEARDVIGRVLTTATVTPEDAEELGGEQTEPAYAALVRDVFAGDILAGLRSLREDITFRCDDGTLTVRRER